MKPKDQKFASKWSFAIASHGFTMIPNVLLNNVFGMGITSSQLAVILILERYRWDKNEEVFPSYETIARQSGQSARTVARCIEQLKEEGLLIVQNRDGTSSAYDVSPLVKLLDEIAASESRPRHSGTTFPRHSDIPTPDNLTYYKYPTVEKVMKTHHRPLKRDGLNSSLRKFSIYHGLTFTNEL